MIRFPHPTAEGRDPFEGTVLRDWIDAANVFDALNERADAHGDATALTFVQTGEPGEQARRVSYRELVAGIAQAANFFRSLGVSRNDGVAYMLPSLVETQFVLWGAEAAGFAVPINFLLQPQQIADLMIAANAKVLVALGPVSQLDIWQKAVDACQRAGGTITLVKLGGGPVELPGVIDFALAVDTRPRGLAFTDRPGPHDVAAYFRVAPRGCPGSLHIPTKTSWRPDTAACSRAAWDRVMSSATASLCSTSLGPSSAALPCCSLAVQS